MSGSACGPEYKIHTTGPTFHKGAVLSLPLVLGWAFAVHKVQVLTLEKVCPQVRESFAHGMLSTALSRVKRLDDLYIAYQQTPDEALEQQRVFRIGIAYGTPLQHILRYFNDRCQTQRQTM
ncbi:hypothetical protein EV179_005643 [Coemansia sp. RSA 487]|nr:hypothetical protein EV179_005643 [Coemansia sp. RSA 487]